MLALLPPAPHPCRPPRTRAPTATLTLRTLARSTRPRRRATTAAFASSGPCPTSRTTTTTARRAPRPSRSSTATWATSTRPVGRVLAHRLADQSVCVKGSCTPLVPWCCGLLGAQVRCWAACGREGLRAGLLQTLWVYGTNDGHACAVCRTTLHVHGRCYQEAQMHGRECPAVLMLMLHAPHAHARRVPGFVLPWILSCGYWANALDPERIKHRPCSRPSDPHVPSPAHPSLLQLRRLVPGRRVPGQLAVDLRHLLVGR